MGKNPRRPSFVEAVLVQRSSVVKMGSADFSPMSALEVLGIRWRDVFHFVWVCRPPWVRSPAPLESSGPASPRQPPPAAVRCFCATARSVDPAVRSAKCRRARRASWPRRLRRSQRSRQVALRWGFKEKIGPANDGKEDLILHLTKNILYTVYCKHDHVINAVPTKILKSEVIHNPSQR